MSAAPITLDSETIRAIAEQTARRTVELLRAEDARDPHRLVDAAEVARELKVSRQWVYEHAGELGARRLGDGPRPRLRFDLEAAREGFACCTSKRPKAQNASAGADLAPPPHTRSRRLPNGLPKPGLVLAIKPQRTAS